MTEVAKPDSDIFALHSAFADTEYGQSLATKIRYERYNLAGLSNEAWEGLLGADVNNLEHMPVTFGLAKDFIAVTKLAQPDLLSPYETTLLKIAAIIHDQGEAIIGDITYSHKTAAHEAEEQRQMQLHAADFAPNISHAMLALRDRAREEVVFAHDGKLGRMFNAIERIGYVRTALRAADHVQAETGGEATAGLRWLVADVFRLQPITLIEYAGEYAAVQDYLLNQRDLITAAFDVVGPEDFLHYGPDQSAKQTAFAATRAAWHDWLQPPTASAA